MFKLLMMNLMFMSHLYLSFSLSSFYFIYNVTFKFWNNGVTWIKSTYTWFMIMTKLFIWNNLPCVVNEALYSAGLGALLKLPTETMPTSPVNHSFSLMYPLYYKYMGSIDPLFKYSRVHLVDYVNISSAFDFYHKYPRGSGFWFFIKNYFYVLKDFFFFSHMSYNIMS